VSRGPGRVRRDGFAAMALFLAAPFGALLLGAAAHPAGILDSEEEILARTEAWRPAAEPAAAEAGVPVDLLLALVATESSGRRDATSPADARGLTQLLPGTAREAALGMGLPATGALDLYDPPLNLRLGAAYLAQQMRSFGGDAALALAAYHRGPRDPLRWRDEAPGRPGTEVVADRAPPVTRAYVERVLARRERFAPPAPATGR